MTKWVELSVKIKKIKEEEKEKTLWLQKRSLAAQLTGKSSNVGSGIAIIHCTWVSVCVSEKGVKSHDREQFVEYATKVNEIKSERNQKKPTKKKNNKVTRTLQTNKQTQAHTHTYVHVFV